MRSKRGLPQKVKDIRGGDAKMASPIACVGCESVRAPFEHPASVLSLAAARARATRIADSAINLFRPPE